MYYHFIVLRTNREQLSTSRIRRDDETPPGHPDAEHRTMEGA